MLHSLQALLAPALAERLTLLLNHVIGAEPVATARLLPHAGRVLRLQLDGWPPLLPAPPVLAWRVTPAGLLEWCGDAEPAAAPELKLHVELGNPLRVAAGLLAGEQPPLRIEGDAGFAADVGWLTQNLRWDIAADLERLFGPVVAQQLAELGGALAGGLRGALAALGERGTRWKPGPR